ncbi:7TM diverse intracellular signaling domain-containing protein [Herbaspirillum sp. NPDC101397]|uniref:sensor histidine kinase n=1 Tax=Herbaspirillum sp. NPDC101397 TaxID=3364006 RepID=UPI00383B7946
MPYQEHLQETGRQLPHTGHLRSARTRFATLISLLSGVILLLFPASAITATTAAAFQRIEAVRADWNAQTPPATGWTTVTLPDDWSLRWPGFDGVVWYRLSWEQTDATAPVGLMMDYLNMAGMVSLNGVQLSRDQSLTEPLTRAWNTPRYWQASPPLLRSGQNILLIRVSGLAAYQPGLGPVTLGTPTDISARYTHEYWLRHDLQLFSLAVSATLGCFFLALWILRRREAEFGWFGLMSLTWWLYASNQIKLTTWPFATTDAWQAAVSILFLVYSASFTMFVLRNGPRRHRRTELAVWAMVVFGSIAMCLTPHGRMQEMRAWLALIPVLTYIASCFLFFYFAWRQRRVEQLILAACLAIFIVVGIHDLLVFLKILDSNIYYSAFASQIQMVAMALVLGWRFVANLSRIECFNEELHVKVESAKEALAQTLKREHELQVVNVRLGERLNLAHDLHDGLGGTLVSSIATLEHAPESIPSSRFLTILKELRDDLRIIIDTASSYQLDETSLAEMLAPLRHRFGVLFESQNIVCRWQLSGIEDCHLPTAQSLDIMRILQEGLTNVLKHSRASRAHVELRGDASELVLRIRDNGIGFDFPMQESKAGTGMKSMQLRTSRLGGTFEVRRIDGETVLNITLLHRYA